MVYVTLEEFMQYKIKCDKCDKNAVWLASKGMPAYCNAHFPYSHICSTQISWNFNAFKEPHDQAVHD